MDTFLPDFNAMTHDAAAAVLGTLTVLFFALAVELGRTLDTFPSKSDQWFLRGAFVFYLIFYIVTALSLLAILNGQGDPSGAWLVAGGLGVAYCVGFFVLLTARGRAS